MGCTHGELDRLAQAQPMAVMTAAMRWGWIPAARLSLLNRRVCSKTADQFGPQ